MRWRLSLSVLALAALYTLAAGSTSAQETHYTTFISFFDDSKEGYEESQNFRDFLTGLNRSGYSVGAYLEGGRILYGPSGREALGYVQRGLKLSTSPINFIYYDGHGGRGDPGSLADIGDRGRFFGEVARSAQELGRQVVFVDGSCYSGTCVTSKQLQDLVNGKTVVAYFGASAPERQAGVGDTTPPFEQGVVERLADFNRDGDITPAEMLQYLQQNPHLASARIANVDLPLFKKRNGATPTPPPATPPTHCLIITPGPDFGFGPDLNARLHREGYGVDLARKIDDAKNGIPPTDRIGIILTPDKQQAQEFLDNGKRGYTVKNGVLMQPGDYAAGGVLYLPDGRIVKVSPECVFESRGRVSDQEGPRATPRGGPGGPPPGAGDLLPLLALQQLLGQGGAGRGGAPAAPASRPQTPRTAPPPPPSPPPATNTQANLTRLLQQADASGLPESLRERALSILIGFLRQFTTGPAPAVVVVR